MKKSKIIGLILSVILVIGCLSGCTASFEREIKTMASDLSGGLNREIIVYSMTDEPIAIFRGKIDISEGTGGKVMFDLDGKRYSYYNCWVEAVELNNPVETYIWRASEHLED